MQKEQFMETMGLLMREFNLANTVDSYLIEPIQRAMRYPLLLRSVLKLLQKAEMNDSELLKTIEFRVLCTFREFLTKFKQ